MELSGGVDVVEVGDEVAGSGVMDGRLSDRSVSCSFRVDLVCVEAYVEELVARLLDASERSPLGFAGSGFLFVCDFGAEGSVLRVDEFVGVVLSGRVVVSVLVDGGRLAGSSISSSWSRDLVEDVFGDVDWGG